jgi:hypothetical protein
MQETQYTSDTAKLIASGIRSIVGERNSLGSPIVVENYMQQFTGGLGKHVTDLLDTGIRAAKGDTTPRAAWSAADTPGLKAFAARFPSSDTESIKDFYDTRKDRQQDKENLKGLKSEAFKAEQAKQGHNGYDGKEFADMLKAGRDSVKKINDDKTMSPADKRTAIDLTYLFMIETAKKGNAAFTKSIRQKAQ